MPDAATLLHVGEPGFSFADGEIWAVHTAWSGNHTHYAERLFTGAQVIGGGELLLPGEVILQPGQIYSTPWIYGSYAPRPRRGGTALPPLPPRSRAPSVDHPSRDSQRVGSGLFRS